MNFIYRHTVYPYSEAPPEYVALFPRTGDTIVVIEGFNSDPIRGEPFEAWMVIPDSLFKGVWDIYAFVEQATGVNGERVFLLHENRVLR